MHADVRAELADRAHDRGQAERLLEADAAEFRRGQEAYERLAYADLERPLPAESSITLCPRGTPYDGRP